MGVGACVGVADTRVAVLLTIVEAGYSVASHGTLTRRTGIITTAEGNARTGVVAPFTGVGSAALTVAVSRHTFSLEGPGQ